jgi:ornithine carbamoyltransferase
VLLDHARSSTGGSLALEQAENRLHVQKAFLAESLARG